MNLHYLVVVFPFPHRVYDVIAGALTHDIKNTTYGSFELSVVQFHDILYLVICQLKKLVKGHFCTDKTM